MGSATFFDSTRMKQIEDTTVVTGEVDPQNHLILTQRNGDQIDAGSIASNAKMVAEDSASVDVTVGGNGSDISPFQIKAEVKKIPASAVDSGVFDLARIPDQTVVGMLPPAYRGGDTFVKMLNGVWTDTELKWASKYVPNGSRMVRLLKSGPTWVILGQVEDGTYPIELTAAATTYGEQNQINVFSTFPRAVRLPSGIVVLSGLIALVGTVTVDTVLGYISMDCVPDKDLIIACEMGDTARTVRIRASDGAILFQGPPATNSYISLDGLAWPAAGVATWTPVGEGGSAWGANFGPRQLWVDTFGAPSFWKDPYGMVWFRGIVEVKVTTSADDTIMFTLPPTHRADISQHLRGCGNDGFAHFGFAPTVGIQFKINNPGGIGAWLGLSGLVGVTADARLNNGWVTPRALINGWINYNTSSYTRASYLLREDGLRMSAGLLGSGTLGTRVLSLKDKEYWPDNGRIIISSVAAGGRGRIDICSTREIQGGHYEAGGVLLQQGSNIWYSLDGRMWIP